MWKVKAHGGDRSKVGFKRSRVSVNYTNCSLAMTSTGIVYSLSYSRWSGISTTCFFVLSFADDNFCIQIHCDFCQKETGEWSVTPVVYKLTYETCVTLSLLFLPPALGHIWKCRQICTHFCHFLQLLLQANDIQALTISAPFGTDIIQLEEKILTTVGANVVFSLDKIDLSRGGSKLIYSL